VTDGESEGGDCDEVICVGWDEPRRDLHITFFEPINWIVAVGNLARDTVIMQSALYAIACPSVR